MAIRLVEVEAIVTLNHDSLMHSSSNQPIFSCRIFYRDCLGSSTICPCSPVPSVSTVFLELTGRVLVDCWIPNHLNLQTLGSSYEDRPVQHAVFSQVV
ncbi:hypothetical protein PoB_005409600 [Plakobranchus ocellatus]|uniref:Uncharacterized protein n=1 Tax=Plakobranchus ocellatus TaxID=259542 RepID=A0AAV4C4B0_9GAST|nr:hypothetical protein PoB_005409600 [Plakobranchus ocellatus]